MQTFKAKRRRRPLGDHTLAVLRAVLGATLGKDPCSLEVALGRPATPRDWRSAELLAARGLIDATEGRVKIRVAGARVLGKAA